jgi:hypothetical protein
MFIKTLTNYQISSYKSQCVQNKYILYTGKWGEKCNKRRILNYILLCIEKEITEFDSEDLKFSTTSNMSEKIK